MKTIKVSDEIFESLKDFVVDPFDDTAELVIGRLVTTAQKAKKHWSPLDKNYNKEQHYFREELEESVKLL